jgi:hypothetical protein
MRVNVYAEELTGPVELVTKTVDGEEFLGVRFWLYLPVTVNDNTQPGQPRQVSGPFIHRPGDDDSSAVTFWGKKPLLDSLYEAASLIERHYAARGEVL